jgi:hypothetical protein
MPGGRAGTRTARERLMNRSTLPMVGVMALMALFVVAALVATPAFGAPEFLSEFPNKLVNFKQAGKGSLKDLNSETTECQAASILGQIVSKSLAEVDAHFSGCTALGFPANSLGDGAGIILTGTMRVEICTVHELAVGFFFIFASPLHVEIPSLGALLTVLGTFIGIITPDGVNTKGPVKLVFKETSAKTGDPEPTSCGGKTASLLSAIDTKTEVSAALSATYEGEVEKLLTIDG